MLLSRSYQVIVDDYEIDKMIKILTAFFLIGLAADTFSASTSPQGVWRSFDEDTGEAKSLIKIWEENGELKGQISTIFNPRTPNPTCGKCKGSFKNKPIKGMIFLWGLEQRGAGWVGGSILDPTNGKIYKAKLHVIEDGDSMELRGFIGFSLIGRTQRWERVE